MSISVYGFANCTVEHGVIIIWDRFHNKSEYKIMWYECAITISNILRTVDQPEQTKHRSHQKDFIGDKIFNQIKIMNKNPS